MALTPAQLAAGFGTGPITDEADALADLSPQERRWVQRVMAMTPDQLAQLAATVGTAG